MNRLARLFTMILMAGSTLTAIAQDGSNMQQELADRMALKNLVDTFSNLADTKEVDAQVELFTDSAEVVSYHGKEMTSSLKGREELGVRFKAFLDNFDTVYHMNGQQTVDINGDEAIGTAYCMVVLVREENGRKVMTTHGVRYNDEYVRQGGKWLINKRASHFDWTNKQETSE